MHALGVVMIEWSLFLLTSCFFFARIYVRVIQHLDGLGSRYVGSFWQWRWSDTFVTLAWIIMLATAIMDSYLAKFGFPETGLPAVIYPDEVVVLINKITVFEAVIYWWVMDFVKLAMLSFYAEIFPQAVFPNLSRLIKAVGALLVVGIVISPIVLLCYCLPLSKRWSLDKETWLSCQATYLVLPQYIFFPLFEIITDLIVLLIPFFVIRLMRNLTFRQKIGVGTMFSLGILSLVCSSTYMYFLVGIALHRTSNNTYLSIFVAIAAQNTAVMVACMPALRRLFVSKLVRREADVSTQELVRLPKVIDAGQMTSTLGGDTVAGAGGSSKHTSTVPSNKIGTGSGYSKMDSGSSNMASSSSKMDSRSSRQDSSRCTLASYGALTNSS